MKKIFTYAIAGLLGTAICMGCSKESNHPAPTPLDQSTVSAEAKPGAVKLKWTVPADSNYHYVKVTYTLPETGKQCLRLASVKSDTMLVDKLLARYGDITYTLQSCNRDGEGGASSTIVARSLPAPKTILRAGVAPITIPGDKLYTDNQESSEGPIANLVDKDESTFFHMSWSEPTDFPHYIVADLDQTPVQALRFSYKCRDNSNKDNPKEMEIYGSNNFTDGEYDDTKAVLLATIRNLPGGQAANFTSNDIIGGETYRYIWFKILSSTSNSRWVALSELSITKVNLSTYDPETGETIVN